jgi:hypothetical protein
MTGPVIPNVWNGHSARTFRVQLSNKKRLLDPEDKDTVTLWNVWNCWLTQHHMNRQQRHRRGPQISWCDRCCMQNVVKLCHLSVFIAIAASVTVCCAAQSTNRCTDLVISYLGYRIFFSILHPGGNFCLCYIINKFVLPAWSLNLWLIVCATPNIFVGIPSILHTTAAASPLCATII